EDNPPISFRNNKFVRMFEVLTDMYGRPAYNGFDPTPFIAVFFLLFFAFCMGDAGYGLIMIGLGLLLKKVDSFKSYAPLVVTLGIGTFVIGFLFHTFFSMDIATWKIFEPIKGIFLPAKIAGYDGTMVLALIVGIVHLCLAMIVKTYNYTKVKGFANSLGTWGWTLLIVGGTIVGALALMGVLDKTATKWIIIAIGVLSAAGIFLLNDLHRNPLINIGSGLWESYNTVTGLLGDVLSYLRLYALGLAGSMLGKAFNDIGLMILGDGKSIPLWIPFLLIVLVGHTLNIAMCALGAFVHPLRLNFLEFFKNSGYEAAGRNYNPLKKTIKQ
ncbi:MAG: ATPase V, partial [Bacteroidales bacterium]|nr:ATPase V [Bacteroidales bacterium]